MDENKSYLRWYVDSAVVMDVIDILEACRYLVRGGIYVDDNTVELHLRYRGETAKYNETPSKTEGVIFVCLLYRESNTYSTVIEKVIVAE